MPSPHQGGVLLYMVSEDHDHTFPYAAFLPSKLHRASIMLCPEHQPWHPTRRLPGPALFPSLGAAPCLSQATAPCLPMVSAQWRISSVRFVSVGAPTIVLYPYATIFVKGCVPMTLTMKESNYTSGHLSSSRCAASLASNHTLIAPWRLSQSIKSGMRPSVASATRFLAPSMTSSSTSPWRATTRQPALSSSPLKASSARTRILAQSSSATNSIPCIGRFLHFGVPPAQEDCHCRPPQCWPQRLGIAAHPQPPAWRQPPLHQHYR